MRPESIWNGAPRLAWATKLVSTGFNPEVEAAVDVAPGACASAMAGPASRAGSAMSTNLAFFIERTPQSRQFRIATVLAAVFGSPGTAHAQTKPSGQIGRDGAAPRLRRS